MKQILESRETFEAYARIDYNLYLLKKLFNEISRIKNPLEILVDKAVGIEKKNISILLELFSEIISDKKLIEADYSSEEKIVNELKKRERQNISDAFDVVQTLCK